MAFASPFTITVDHTKCGSGGAVANFILLFRGGPAFAGHAYGGNMRSSLGYDVVFFADSGRSTSLPFELVPGTYDPTTGYGEWWINLGTGGAQLSSSSDAVIYGSIDDASISTFQGDVANTWPGIYELVIHGGDGTTLSGSDSSTNGNNLTNNGATATAGVVVGGAIDFNGSNSYLHTGTTTGLPAGNDLTVQCWSKQRTRTDNVNSAILDFLNGGSGNAFVWQSALVGGTAYLWTDAVANALTLSGAEIPSLNAWHRLELQCSSGGYGWRIDGAVAKSGGNLGLSTHVTGLDIGRRASGTTGYLDAILDEIRVISSAASITQDHSTAEFNNQIDPDSFYGVAGITGGGGSSVGLMPGFIHQRGGLGV